LVRKANNINKNCGSTRRNFGIIILMKALQNNNKTCPAALFRNMDTEKQG
jgi:hypothetical protein